MHIWKYICGYITKPRFENIKTQSAINENYAVFILIIYHWILSDNILCFEAVQRKISKSNVILVTSKKEECFAFLSSYFSTHPLPPNNVLKFSSLETGKPSSGEIILVGNMLEKLKIGLNWRFHPRSPISMWRNFTKM